MNKTVGVVAHVDAGKTTLLEQLLYNANAIKKPGRVDNKNTILDYHTIEKERGITVYSDQISVEYIGSKFHFIDTPGHVDFSAEMERTVRILDCAVIVLSAVEGIEGHTHTVWRMLRKYNIPTIFFINKMDRVGADFSKVYCEIKKNFTDDLCLFSEPVVNEDEIDIINLASPLKFDEKIVEFLADRDEKILEKYFKEEDINVDMLKDKARSLIAKGQMFPCLCGSGLKNKGIRNLLEILDGFISTEYIYQDDFRATVYKIRHDKNGNKETFIKVNSGKIKVKDIVEHNKTGLVDEKVNAISVSKGGKQIRKDELNAGEIGLLSGLKHSYIGEGLGCERDFNDFVLIPALRAKVLYGDKINPKEILAVFNILTEEDPSMDAVWIEELGEININVMGLIQLEVLQHVIKERFEIEVEFGKPEVLYKETIVNEVMGFGHFEPYKHFSEVEISISPGSRGKGVNFFSKCSVDKLDLKWQRNIEKNIEDGCKKGILTGSEVTDVNITLVSGRAHEKHTSGGDFRQATFRAIRHGLEQSESILLEPYYDFSVKVSQELSGRVMTDMINMKGLIDPPVSDGNYAIISGIVPVSTSMDYPAELASFSGGKGVVVMCFNGYGKCYNQDQVVEKINYDKDGDSEYTSYSVYCSKGKVYTKKGKKE